MTGLGGVIFLRAVHSLDYVETVFRLYAEGRPFAIVKSPDPQFSHPALGEGPVVEPGTRLGWGGLTHQPRSDTSPAQIVFTSGTEGQPKAVVLSHGNLADVVTRLNDVMGLDASVREYVGVPVTFSFGLGRVRAVSAVGGAFYLPERFDPAEIRDMLARDEINAISAVPSLWRILLAHPSLIGSLGEKVRWIEIGSQYMSGPEKEALRKLFPQARIVQHYGLTEASRSTFLDLGAGQDLESVGWCLGDTQIRIGVLGEICIKGAHVALGILQPGGALVPIVDSEGWFHTSDKGEIRDGLLWYQGRLDDQINVAGVKLAAETIEAGIRALVPAARDFAVTGVPDALRGEAVLLALGPGAMGLRDLIRVATETVLRNAGVLQSGALHQVHLTVLPLTDTGKVQRKALRADWAPSKPEAPPPSDAPLGLLGSETRVAAIWGSVLGQGGFAPDRSFYHAGGDSLAAMQIGLAMEAAGFARAAVRATLEGRSLREVAALCVSDATAEGIAAGIARPANPLKPWVRDPAPPFSAPLPSTTVETWAINALRGFMVLTVLLSHWGPGVIARLGMAPWIDPVLSPFYRMGTAGFATVFGLSLGFFMLGRMRSQPGASLARLRAILGLVAAGFVLNGATLLGSYAAQGFPMTPRVVTAAFYNILGFYLVALFLAPPLLSFLARRAAPAEWALGIGLCLWPLGWGLAALLPVDPLDSYWEWPRLMLVARYSLFITGPLVVLGVAAGIWLASRPDPLAALVAVGRLAFGGLILVVLIIAQTLGLGQLAEPLGDVYFTILGGMMDFAFAFALLGALCHVISHWHIRSFWQRLPLQGLIVLGGLALPIFVFHRIVIPVKEILSASGLPESLALLVPLSAFLAAFAYGARRLWRMYFP